jgi:hypothetical protein
MNAWGVFRNSAMAAQARIIYDRVNAQRFGAEREGAAGIGKARGLMARAAALNPPPVLTVEQARARLRGA